MRIPQTIMLLIQYTYYDMKKGEKPRWGFPAGFTRVRALGVLGLVETAALAAVYLFIARIIVGHRIPKPPFPSLMFPEIAAFIYGLIVYYINKSILGPESRIHHYKKIFDAWDEGKRLRWKILLISIAISSIAGMYVVGEITQNGPDPHNWKY